MYRPPMQILRNANPMLARYLRRSAFDIHDESSRNLFQIEGYMRYRQGQISQEEMTQRGTFLSALPLLTMVPSGTAVSLDSENQTTTHDSTPIGHTERRSTFSYIGAAISSSEGRGGRVFRVDNRSAIKQDAIYMWTVSSSHTIRDICDDYHGRIFRGYDVPPPLHFGCNCQIREIDQSQLGASDNIYSLTQMGEHNVWGNVHRFVDEVNQLNFNIDSLVTTATRARDDIQDAASGVLSGIATIGAFMLNPEAFIVDLVATKLVDSIKQAAINYAHQQIQTTILSQIDESHRSLAEAILNNNISGEVRNRLVSSSPQLQETMRYISTAKGIVSGFGNVNSVSSGIDYLQSSARGLDSLGIGGDRIRRIADSPILHQTKAKAVMLEGGFKGLTRLAMILF